MAAQEYEREAEAIQRLADLLDAIYGVLSDSELLYSIGKLLITPETLLVIDRLPQLMSLLEKLTRDDMLQKLGVLADLLGSIDADALSSALKAAVSPPSLASLVRGLGDPEVRRGLAVALALARALGTARPPESQK